MSKPSYVAQYCKVTKKTRYEHIVVWEKAYGPVPKGFEIHHRNEIKNDNRLENLECITPMIHRRTHAGCYKEDGKWIRPCSRCKKHKDLDKEYYKSNGYPYGECKPCHIKRVLKGLEAKRNV